MVKINKFEFENIKRVKAVTVTPTENGLTIIGGDNAQGKTSILDAIAWALGGNKYKPSEPNRDGSVLPPNLNITLSNGLVVERSGKNSTLKVIDPAGNKAGQQLLDTFIEQLAIDLPKFMESSSKQKADILLKIIGVDAELAQLELEEQNLYNERLAIGRIADQKKKYAEEQEFYPDAPEDLVSASELIQQQQAILAKNGENQRKRENAQRFRREVDMLKLQYEDIQSKLKTAMQNLEIAETDALDLQDQSTEELEENIRNIEEINRKVRANLDKNKAEEDAKDYLNKYDSLTVEITKIRDAKAALLDNANLPLEGLSVANGELIYKNQKWDNMSSAEQLKVSTAIVRKLNPECGFVLLDKLECMDLKTLEEFGRWLEQEGLQAIATRVSQGDECSIIIEDGYIKEEQQATETEWKEGVF
jgi:chromosome segregation ATPase